MLKLLTPVNMLESNPAINKVYNLHFLWKKSCFEGVAVAETESNKQSTSGLSDLTLLLHAWRELALSNSSLRGANDSIRNNKERRSSGWKQ